MTTVEIKAPVVGHYKIKHYRRGQLINEIGCNNAIDPAWIRTGLVALAQGATDNNNVAIAQRSPTSMRVKYYPSSSPTSQVFVDKDVVLAANGAQSTGVDQVTSRLGGLIAEFTATGSGSGYINTITQAPSNTATSLDFEIEMRDGTGVLSSATATNTTQVIQGDDLNITYELVVGYAGIVSTGNAAILPSNGGLTQAAAGYIARRMVGDNIGGAGATETIANIGVYESGNNGSSGFGDPTDFNATPGNTSTGFNNGWLKGDFDPIVGSTSQTVSSPDVSADTSLSVGVQKSLDIYPTATTNTTVPTGAFAKDGTGIVYCQFPSAGSNASPQTSQCGYLVANYQKRHSLRFTISLSAGTLSGLFA